MRQIGMAFVFCSLSGCIAVWGGAYHVESEDSSGGAIRYDHVVISERAVLVHANEICAKYQKAASIERESYGVVLPGGSIDEMSFSCQAPSQQTSVQTSNSDTADRSYSVSADQTVSGAIALQNDGGTFVVPVTINNSLTLKFTVDSGSADVSIPADVVMTLMRIGSVRNSDFLGKRLYRLADGSTTPSNTFRIRTLKVGDYEIENVTGSIAGVEGGLLLGQSFLRHFKSWSIDNQHHTLILN